MFRSGAAVFALIIFCSSEARAQVLPGPGQSYSTFAPQFDRANFQTVGAIIQNFEDVCFSVYRAATENPDRAITQQDVDWPVGYRSFTDRQSKRIDDIKVEINIDFDAAEKKFISVSEWGGSQMVTRQESTKIPAIHCEFSLSIETDWQPMALRNYVKAAWRGRKAQTKIQNETSQYALEQINHDCDTGKVRVPTIYYSSYKKDVSVLHFNFPRDAFNDAADLTACTSRAFELSGQYGSGFGGGYTVRSDGYVIGPNKKPIGRIRADGDIINDAGQVIGRIPIQ